MPVPQKSRGEMDPEELAAARRQNKRASYLRSIGKPVRITPEEFAEVKALVTGFHRQGMAFSDMQRQTGLIRHIFGDVVNGRRKSLNRESYEKMLTLQYAPSAKRGSYPLDPTGSIRRIEALRALGFPFLFIATQLGCEPQNIRYLGERSVGIYLATKLKIEALYEKYRDRDPAEIGYPTWEIKRQKTIARKHGFAPPMCWDEDTIDDPNAIPEWTGHCGTVEGYLTHEYGTVPLCKPCADAVRLPNGSLPRTPGTIARQYQIRPEVVTAVLDRQGSNPHRMEVDMGLPSGCVGRWLARHYSPRLPLGMRVAGYLDIPWTGLYEKREES